LSIRSASLRSSFVESRFEALHASGITELVGREEELDCFEARLDLQNEALPWRSSLAATGIKA
jgi:hypothetical protein